MKFYKNDGKEKIFRPAARDISLEGALKEIDKIPVLNEGYLGFINEKGESIFFVRFEKEGWMLTFSELDINSNKIIESNDQNIRTASVKEIIKRFFNGEDFKTLCNLKPDYIGEILGEARSAENILIDNRINDQEKVNLLRVIHHYTEEEAWELLRHANRQVQSLKLDNIKRQISSKVNELYGNIPSDDERKPIPDDVKIFVWQRDRGQCVKCGSREELEFDHTIPIAKGGSSTARNIQLLCENCNRSKSDNIV